MKIVNKTAFLLLPDGTVFSKYVPCVFSNIEIKGATVNGNDYLYQEIADSIKCEGSCYYSDKLHDAVENGASLEMDFDSLVRDGSYDDEQLYAVWSKKDVKLLIKKLLLDL